MELGLHVRQGYFTWQLKYEAKYLHLRQYLFITTTDLHFAVLTIPTATFFSETRQEGIKRVDTDVRTTHTQLPKHSMQLPSRHLHAAVPQELSQEMPSPWATMREA